jgi:gliding motility-associated-like protein
VATFTVNVLSPGTLDLGPDQEICPGASLVLDATTAGASYQWQDGSTAPSFAVQQAGTYWVEVTVSACTISDTIVVTTTPLTVPELGPDLTLCEGDSTVLQVVPGAASVLWSTGSTDPEITVSSADQYSVTLSLNGCTTTDAIEVNVVPFIDQIDLGPDRPICPGEKLTLGTATIAPEYVWSTGANTPTIQIEDAGLYVLSISGSCASASDTVLVFAGNCPPLVYVPNAFSPDGDGMNEVFGPVITGTIDDYELLVFDRWGEVIFTSNDRSAGWDGRVDGTDAQQGVYVWSLGYKAVTDVGVRQERITGSVTLLR